MNILDGDFSVRLMNCARQIGATTTEELRAKLEDPNEIYITGSLIAARKAQYFNKKRILEELNKRDKS